MVLWLRAHIVIAENLILIQERLFSIPKENDHWTVT